MPKTNVDKLSDVQQELKLIVEKYNRGIVETDYEKTESGRQFEETLMEAIRKIELAEGIYENNDTLSKPPNVDAVADEVFEHIVNENETAGKIIEEYNIKQALDELGYEPDSPLGKSVVKELR